MPRADAAGGRSDPFRAVFVGALYGLLGSASPGWGLLRLINLAHFAFAFLAAYLCYQLAHQGSTRCSRSR